MQANENQDVMRRQQLLDPLRQRYVDPYKELPVTISGPVAQKGYTGIIKSFNPNRNIADVQLDINMKTILVKLEFLRF
jgi:hypothetical protein